HPDLHSFPTRRSSDLDAGDPVEHAMVRLADDGEARFAQALHQPHLPERLVPIERLREQAADQLLQLGFSARRGQSGVAHVVLERSEEHTSELQSLAYL